jgi:tyrosine-protein phosphatase YwqE
LATEIITTPHIIQHVWDNTHEGIASKKVETIQQRKKNNITIPFKPAEYLMDDQYIFNLMIY